MVRRLTDSQRQLRVEGIRLHLLHGDFLQHYQPSQRPFQSHVFNSERLGINGTRR